MRYRGKLFFAIFFVVIFIGAIYGQNQTKRFAVIGDFGSGDNNERDVANLVRSWNPDFIITVGDNNYPSGETATMDQNVGQFYHDFIFPYQGSYGAGATVNRFYPALGNHDWDNTVGAPAQPYKNYFTLPNNERYYDYVEGSVHFFVIDSDSREPDGISGTSVQAQWLHTKLTAATEPWKIVYLHHTPYSSRTSTTALQWQFQQWGATAVIAGHAHVYERVLKNGFPYFTNGLGGESKGSFNTPIAGSVVRFGDDYGAQLVTANDDSINFQFITRAGVLIDSYTISNLPLNAPTNLTASTPASGQVTLSWTDNSSNEDGFQIERCQNSGCTNFTVIADVPPNVSSYSDGGMMPETIYSYRVRAFNSGGNSAYSNVIEIMTPAAGAVLFNDDFNDNSRDPAKWNVGIFSRITTNIDPLVQVAETGGRLSVTPRSSFSSASYNGYLSSSPQNLTDASAVVELVQKANGNAATIFSVGTDKNNWYSFRAKGSSLMLESRINSTTTSVNLTYNAAAHRFCRFRHITATDSIVFETSPDTMSWTTQRSVLRQIPLTALLIEMIAGTGESIAAPGTALFDNFAIVSNQPAVPPPAAPGNLTANAISTSQIDLAWTDNSNDEDGFKVERCQNAGCTNFAEIAQIPAASISYRDEGLSAITVYRYRVRAFHASVNSGYSNIAETTTPAPPPSPPLAPSNLTATAVSTDQINLRWSVNSANEDGFKIERCQNAGCTNFTEIAQLPVDTEQFMDANLLSATVYAYRVRAFNGIGNSSYSNTAETATQSAAPPDTPSDLTGTAVSPTQINISWTDNSNNESGFKIERCQNAGCTDFIEINQTAANATAYSDTALSGATTYQYRVRAFNVYGDSVYTSPYEIATPSPPVSVFADDFNDDVRDPAKWNVGIFSRSTSNLDPLVQVAETGGRLVITPRTGVHGNSYNGYVSVNSLSLVNSNAAVELVQKASGNAAAVFSVGTDKNNWYAFRVKGSTLYMENRIGGSTASISLSFNAVLHRFWRIRHDPISDSVLFETSADGAMWTVRRTVARQIALTSVKLELIAGTSESVAAPGTAQFDNFIISTN